MGAEQPGLFEREQAAAAAAGPSLCGPEEISILRALFPQQTEMEAHQVSIRLSCQPEIFLVREEGGMVLKGELGLRIWTSARPGIVLRRKYQRHS
jgi:hypothetical protein